MSARGAELLRLIGANLPKDMMGYVQDWVYTRMRGFYVVYYVMVILVCNEIKIILNIF